MCVCVYVCALPSSSSCTRLCVFCRTRRSPELSDVNADRAFVSHRRIRVLWKGLLRKVPSSVQSHVGTSGHDATPAERHENNDGQRH